MTDQTEILVYSEGRRLPLPYARTMAWYNAMPPVKQRKFVVLGLWKDKDALIEQFYSKGLKSFTAPSPKPVVYTPAEELKEIIEEAIELSEANRPMTLAQMREMCIEAGYPAEEWQGFKGSGGRKKMEEYLNSKK